MPLKSLLRYLLHNERLVQRLADSAPMRRLARACLAAFYRTQDAAKRGVGGSERLRSYVDQFEKVSKELKDTTAKLKDKEK